MGGYSRQKRSRISQCNICKTEGELTWDHVPPKACLNDIPVKINRLMDGFPQYNKYKEQSQNGVKYRTICSHCNNSLLGTEYDPHLINFTQIICNTIEKAAKTANTSGSFAELNDITIPVHINRIARAICGHMLAANHTFNDVGRIDNELRSYFLTPNALPPSVFCLLYWFYPFSTISIARDFYPINVMGEKSFQLPTGVCSIISSFPAAYILCDNSYSGDLPNLFSFCTSDIDAIVDIPFKFSSCFLYDNILRPPLWPANVTDDPDGVDLIITSETTTGSSVLGLRNISYP